MNIYHIGSKIVQVNWDKDDFNWDNTTNNASMYHIDELDPVNKALCIDIARTQSDVDANGLAKYYIASNATGWDLMERSNWAAVIPPYY